MVFSFRNVLFLFLFPFCWILHLFLGATLTPWTNAYSTTSSTYGQCFAQKGLLASLRDAPDLFEAEVLVRYSIPRLATLGWGYVHLCRDAPDLFEAVSGCCRGAIPRLASTGCYLHHCRDIPDLSLSVVA